MNSLKSLRQRSCGCCLLLVLLLLLLAAGVIFLAVRAAQAAGINPPIYDVVLLADQSPSMWDCDGVGTDPQMLRVDAARLFINYLGADSSARYRLALLHFGGEVQQVAPLTDLADTAARQGLVQAANQPQPIRWTDPLLALRTADKLLRESGRPDSRRLIVLLTDGEPAWPPERNLDMESYLRKLKETVASLAKAQTTLAVVLLSDLRTSCGRYVAVEWTGHWTQLAEMTPGGALYTANQAEDLLPVYHAIVRELSGATESREGIRSATLAQGRPLILPVNIDDELSSLILTVWRAEATTTVQVLEPAGKIVTPAGGSVTVIGQGGGSREEVWRIERPVRGTWQIVLNGKGRVSVWLDRLVLPTATPSPTSSPTQTPTSTSTATPTPTVTASPTATASASATVSPSASATASPTGTGTATAIPPPPTPQPTETPEVSAVTGLNTDGTTATQRSPWPWLGGTAAVLAAGGGVLVARGRGRGRLSGQLVPVAGPAKSLLALPRDLGSERRRCVYLGRRGQAEWRLAGWPGSLKLEADARGGVRATAVEGEASLNGEPLAHGRPLTDGDTITCGEYRIRYENLLA